MGASGRSVDADADAGDDDDAWRREALLDDIAREDARGAPVGDGQRRASSGGRSMTRRVSGLEKRCGRSASAAGVGKQW